MRKLIGLFVLVAAVVAFTAPTAFAGCASSHKTAEQSKPAQTS
ncbi:hypothetical protein [Nisaea nitritireducens]|nr:hypothetical protein [Nisaea nitritireducens]